MTMTDKVTRLPKSKKPMMVGWREHRDRLSQTEKDIQALRYRLEKQRADFYAVMLKDIQAEGDQSDRETMTKTMEYFAKYSGAALALLECEEDRVGHTTPDDWCFEYRRGNDHNRRIARDPAPLIPTIRKALKDAKLAVANAVKPYYQVAGEKMLEAGRSSPGPTLISHAAVGHVLIPCCLLSLCLCSTP
jgi:hypothetical protein